MTHDRVFLRIAGLGAALLLTVGCAVGSPSEPTAVQKAPTSQSGDATAKALAEGTFIKAEGQAAIFVVRNGTKRAFPNMETFVGWGGAQDASNVVVLSTNQLEAIPTGDSIPNGSRP